MDDLGTANSTQSTGYGAGVPRCPACAAEAGDGLRFCTECGTSLAVRHCSACGEPVAGGQFCGQCGASLAPGTEASAQHAQAPTDSPALAERRVTSVLFADLVSFTVLAGERDAEDVRELLTEYFVVARTVVERYGGVVEKFIGDAVMAVWGVPTAHEDDAERAVRAGLELIDAVVALGERVAAEGLAMRVGILTGEVAVTVGARDEGMVAGDAVNTASRIQSVAGPGRVWVDDVTRGLTATAVTYTDLGEHQLKGKPAPVRLWEAVAVVAEVGGGQRVDGLEAPLAGRGRELRLVKDSFHACQADHRPSLLLVMGEAGVGKSRLAWEFEKYVDGLSRTVFWHGGRCLSYGEGVAFWALREAIRGRLGLLEEDTGPQVGLRLAEAVHDYAADPEEAEWLQPRLAALVDTTLGTPALPREDLFAAWVTFLERVGRGGDPVVLVIDDAQYADDGLLDFLDYLMETARAAVLVLVLSRPELFERRPELGGARTTVVRLDLLDDEAMGAMVDALVDGLPRTTREELVQRAEGVPLFAVETVRALIDRDLVVPREGRYVVADEATVDLGAIGAPASLQALVAARLDALTADERRTVADASVLGATFTRAAIHSVSTAAASGAELDDVLARLQRKQILTVSTDRLSSERGQFRFVHGVVRQVAYATMSRRDRKVRHLAAAQHLGGLADPGGELAVVIAQHYLDVIDASATDDADRQESTRRACELLVRAAERATALGSPAEARRLYGAALDRSPGESRERALLLVRAAQAARSVGDFADTDRIAAEAVHVANVLDDPGIAGTAAATQAQARIDAGGDLALAVDLVLPYWDRLADLPDSVPARLACANVLTRGYVRLRDWSTAVAFCEQTVRLAEAAQDYEALAAALRHLATVYSSTGAPLTASVLLRAGVDLARRHERLEELSAGLMTLVTVHAPRDLDAAVTTARESLTVALRTGAVLPIDFAVANLALVCWLRGDWTELDALLAEQTTKTHTGGMHELCTSLADWLALARGGDTPVGQASVAAATGVSSAGDESGLSWASAMEAARSELAGDLPTAVRHAMDSLEHALRWSELEDDYVYLWPRAVRLALRAEDVQLAAALMEPVEQAPAGLLTPALGAYLAELRGRIGVARGEPYDAVCDLLRAAIAQLDEYGANPDAARTRELLGDWMSAHGRADEGAALVEAAEAEYSRLGAKGWLAAERRSAPR